MATSTPTDTLVLETICLDFAGRGATIADICNVAGVTRGHAVMSVKRLAARKLIGGTFDGANIVYVGTVGA